MSAELELKLELDPEDFGSVTKQRLFGDAKHHSKHQLSVYYDTPGSKLRKNGFTLRVRSTEQGFIQTVKTVETGAGLFLRGEWETPVGSIEPDVEELKRTPAGEVSAKKLRPVVTCEVERTIWRSESKEGLLEFALDSGELHADGRETHLCELEIELLRGEPARAFDAAGNIAEKIPVRIGVLSKSERGFALANGTLGKPAKAPPVLVRSDMNVAEGFGVIAQSCLRHFRLNEQLVLQDRDSRALHQARVAMRRLRSTLSLFRPVLQDADFLHLREELRWFTGQLGTARNLDVYLDRELPIAAREVMSRDREEAYDNAISVLNSKRFRVLMIDFVRWISLGQWRRGDRSARPLSEFGRRRIDRLWRKLTAHDDLRHMDDEGRHAVRIEIKKLRYGLEFLQALNSRARRKQKQFLAAVAALQGSLGLLNDIVTARHLAMSAVPQSTDSAQEPELIAQAERRLRRLKKIGPYWSQLV